MKIGQCRIGREEEHLLVELYLHPFGDVAIEKRAKRRNLRVLGNIVPMVDGLMARDVHRLWKLRSKGLIERVHASLKRWQLTPAGLEVAKVLAVKAQLTRAGGA